MTIKGQLLLLQMSSTFLQLSALANNKKQVEDSG